LFLFLLSNTRKVLRGELKVQTCYNISMTTSVIKTKRANQFLSRQVTEKQPLHSSAKDLEEALSEFGGQLVMRASDECRVLPHILNLIGKGGEHIVFEDIRFPNYILKVNFIETLPVLYAQSRGEEEISKAVADIERKAGEHRERMKRLQSYFLFDQVPTELMCVKKLPLNEKIVKAILRDRNIEIPKKMVIPETMPVLCILQRRIEIPKKEDRIDIYSSYAELNRTIKLEYYVEGHRLLASSNPIGPLDNSAREKIITYIYPSLKKVIKVSNEDPGFRHALAGYIKRVMHYSADTNEIIDMAGGGNVMFRKNEFDCWEPFLMDALSPSELNFDLIRTSALLIKHGKEVDVRTKANTLNVLNYIRFANALAIIARIGTRLEVSDTTTIPPESWHSGLMIEKYLDVYTPKQKT